MVLLLAPVVASAATAVDYAHSPPFEEGDMTCKPTGKGLKCTSKAGDAEDNTWTTFGPVHPVGTAMPTHVEARFSMKWGGSSGVAFGVADGHWTGVLISTTPKSQGYVWAGAWDGQTWLHGIAWTPLLDGTGAGPHVIEVDASEAEVVVRVDGLDAGRFKPQLPLQGVIAPVMMGRGGTRFESLTIEVAAEPEAATPLAWELLEGPPPEWYDIGYTSLWRDGDTLVATVSQEGPVALATSASCGRAPWVEAPLSTRGDLDDRYTRSRTRPDGTRYDTTDEGTVVRIPPGGTPVVIHETSAPLEPRVDIGGPWVVVRDVDITNQSKQVLVSRDAGATWTEVPDLVGRITMMYADGDGLFAVEPDLLWTSTDGTAWTRRDTVEGARGRFGQLLRCGGDLLFLNEDLEVYALRP